MQPFVTSFQLAEGVEQALRDQCQIGRVLLFDALPAGDGVKKTFLLHRDIALQLAGAHAFAVFFQRGLQMGGRLFGTRADQFGRCQFAVVLGDLLLGRHFRQFGGNGDGLAPVFFELIDFQKIALGFFG